MNNTKLPHVELWLYSVHRFIQLNTYCATQGGASETVINVLRSIINSKFCKKDIRYRNNIKVIKPKINCHNNNNNPAISCSNIGEHIDNCCFTDKVTLGGAPWHLWIKLADASVHHCYRWRLELQEISVRRDTTTNHILFRTITSMWIMEAQNDVFWTRNLGFQSCFRTSCLEKVWSFSDCTGSCSACKLFQPA